MSLVLGGGWRLGCPFRKLINHIIDSCSHNTIGQQPGWRAYSGAALRARPVGVGACPWHPSSDGLCIAERGCYSHGVWVETLEVGVAAAQKL